MWKKGDLYESKRNLTAVLPPAGGGRRRRDPSCGKRNSVPCTVPGNVELDLSRAGILPDDLYKGENIRKAEAFEIYEWWYETAFAAPAAPQKNHRMMPVRGGGLFCGVLSQRRKDP